MTQAAALLLGILLGLFTLSVLLRFYLRLVAAPFHHPFSQAVVAITDFAVRPAQRFIPSWRRLDIPTLALAFLAQFTLQLTNLWLQNNPIQVVTTITYVSATGLALIQVLRLLIYIVLYAVVIQAILSWINPHSPAAPILRSMTWPITKHIQRWFRIGGGVDLSPLIVFIASELLLILVVNPIEGLFLNLH